MEEVSIGEIARRVGVRTSALRYYESVGLLPAPQRVGGQRRYDARVVQRLAIIQLAQRAGFTIAELQTLVHGFDPDTPPASRWRTLAQQKLRELDALIEQARQMQHLLVTGLNCGCLQLDDCAIALADERAVVDKRS